MFSLLQDLRSSNLRRGVMYAIALVMGVVLGAQPSGALDIELLWSVDLDMVMEGAPIVVAQYRLAPAMGFHFGATGIGYWSYNVGESMWDAVEHEYPIVYTNPDGTQTSSRRWEAVREGMEDTRILIALRDKLADPSVSPAAKEKIRHLLDKTLQRISRQALEEARLGVARYVLDASNNDATVETLRAEIMDCVALLAVRDAAEK